MRHTITFQCLLIMFLFSVIVILPAYSVDVTVAFLAGSNDLGEVEEAAYNWVNDEYPTTLLVADNSGTFKTDGGTAKKLDDYAVLWLFYTETNQLPASFLADGTKKAILNYVEAGGGIFLSALGLKYVVDMGVDDGGNARVLQPLGKGPPEIGINPTAVFKDHPVYKGFDTSKPIFLTSMDQAGFSADFINFKAAPPAGNILGTKTRGGGAGAGERPFVEYEVDEGKIITLGHHNGVYTDTKSPESDNLRKLTMNVLNYLGENSAFFAVDPNGKLATTWGKLKSTSK
ncbi:MAG: DUF4960 domain-containing protein [Candidatus Poribacteria bacterium]|nr:DUF4960 domain-containing protein [Candidatus Poribacteria bacterium]